MLDLCGFSNIWSEQNYVNHKWISTVVKQRLQDQFIQKWFCDINGSSKGQIYRLFKTSFGFENYINMLPNKFRKIFIKFRTSNHHLPVETGRWYNVPLNERVCKLCNSGHTADEFHYILECKELANLRKKYLHTKYCTSPNIMKFSELMSNDKLFITEKIMCVYFQNLWHSWIVCPSCLECFYLMLCTCIFHTFIVHFISYIPLTIVYVCSSCTIMWFEWINYTVNCNLGPHASRLQWPGTSVYKFCDSHL